MRISDWSSDVCSSDLNFAIADHELDRASFNSETRTGLSQDRDVAAASLAEAEVRAGNDAADAKLVAEPLLDKRVRRECGDRSVKRDCHRVVGAELPEKPVRLDKARKEKRSEEHTSELQSLMRISYAVFCLKKKKKH